MLNSTIPAECERLAALRAYQILDTPGEEAFDRVTRLACAIFRVPIGLVSLIDDQRQWFKSCQGLEARETSRDVAFCAHAIKSTDVLVVPDATQDARFSANPFVTGAPHIRFYAGAPLITPSGHALGTLCIIDHQPREFPPAEQQMLKELAATVVDALELRLAASRMQAEISERKQAELALRESEARKAAVLRSALDGVITIDHRGVVCEVNEATERIFGYTAAEMVGADMASLIVPPELREAHAQGMRTLLATGEGPALGRRLEMPAVRSDGSRFPIELAIVQIPLEGPPMFTGHIRDITARKAAEEALRESEERFRQFAEHILEVFWMLDAESGQVLYLSPAYEQVWGASPDDVYAGRASFRHAIHPEDSAPSEAALAQLRRGEPAEVDYRIVRDDGSILWVKDRGFPVIDETGKVTRLLGAAKDITAWMEAEQALRENQARLERITANVPGMVYQFLLRADGSVAFPYVSEGCHELHGCTAEELQADANMLLQNVVEDQREEFTRSVAASAATLQPWEMELQLSSPSGCAGWVHCISRPQRQPNGDTLWDGVVVDITERKLAQEELRASRDEANRANRAKSEFLSRMSHELRTPLNAILGFGQLLERSTMTPRQSESIGYILKAGDHLLRMINEVLDLARIESGRLELSLESVEVSLLVEEVLQMIRPMASDRQLIITSNTVPGLYLHADRQRTKQVLVNLLSNAVKYNTDGGSVHVECRAGEAGRLQIRVSDTGVGIAADQIERLFVPFERLGAEQSSIEGTGIGLAICRCLVESMGGAIAVESTRGEGSTFLVDFPAAAATPAPEISQESTSVTRLLPTPAVVRHRVLYVEDNSANRRLMESILEDHGEIELVSAGSAEEGLSVAQTQPPELVLLDLHLPGLSGEAFLQQFRAQPRFARVPVVVVSADAMPAQISRLREAGAGDYLTKPLEVGQVLATVERHLASALG